MLTESVTVNLVEQPLANWLGALSTAVDHSIADAGAAYMGSQMSALLTLLYFSDTSVGELGRILGLTGSGAVRLLDRLEHDGFVERHPGQGRSVTVRLTDDGQHLASNLQRRRLCAIEDMLAQLTEDERRQLGTLVAKLLRHAELSPERAKTVCRLCDHHMCEGAGCPIGASLRARGAEPPRANIGTWSV